MTRRMTGQALNTKHRVLLRPIESHDGIPALLRPQWTQFDLPEALSYCRHAPLDDKRESKRVLLERGGLGLAKGKKPTIALEDTP